MLLTWMLFTFMFIFLVMCHLIGYFAWLSCRRIFTLTDVQWVPIHSSFARTTVWVNCPHVDNLRSWWILGLSVCSNTETETNRNVSISQLTNAQIALLLMDAMMCLIFIGINDVCIYAWLSLYMYISIGSVINCLTCPRFLRIRWWINKANHWLIIRSNMLMMIAANEMTILDLRRIEKKLIS